jgi:hypothetical protein
MSLLSEMQIDEKTRKILLTAPSQMLKAWEARQLQGTTLEAKELEIRKLRFLLPKQMAVMSLVLLAFFVIDSALHLGQLLFFVGGFLLMSSIPFLKGPAEMRFRYEKAFCAFRTDLQAIGLFELVEQGYDFQRIQRHTNERLVGIARDVLLAQAEIKRARYDDKVTEDQLGELLEERSSALSCLQYLRKKAEELGLQPWGKDVYYEGARKSLLGVPYEI